MIQKHTWEELPPDASGSFASGAEPRFIADPVRRSVRILTDEGGFFLVMIE